MLLAEPPPSPADLHFRFFGVPVRVHPFFWLVTLMLGYHPDQTAVDLLIWIGAVFVSILIHEFGHAAVARLYGWPPHITLYGMGGLASYRPTHHDARSQVLISAAGPAAGFLLIGFVMAVVQAAGHRVFLAQADPLPYWIFYLPEFQSVNLNMLVKDLLLVNIFWGLVNLLPIFPLDGGRIAMELLGHLNPHDGARQSLWLSVFTAAAVAVAAAVALRDIFMAVFFGYMAFSSFQILEQMRGRGGFGGPRG